MEIWMKDYLVSDSNCNTPQNLQGMTNTIGLMFSVGDTILQFTISIEQDHYIGDTKYRI